MLRSSDIVGFGADPVEIELASDQRPFRGMLIRAQNARQDVMYAERALNVDLSSGVIAPRGGSAYISRSFGVTSAQVTVGSVSIPLSSVHGFSSSYWAVTISTYDGSLEEQVSARRSGSVLELQAPLTTGPYPAGSVVQTPLMGVSYRGMGIGRFEGRYRLFADAGVNQKCRRQVWAFAGEDSELLAELYVETLARQASSNVDIVYPYSMNGFVVGDVLQIGTGDTYVYITSIDYTARTLTVNAPVTLAELGRIRVVSRPTALRDNVTIMPYGNMMVACHAADNISSDPLSSGKARPWCIAKTGPSHSYETKVMPLGIQPMRAFDINVAAIANGESQLASGTYELVFTYYSSHTKAESEPTEPISISVSAGFDITVTFYTPGLSAESHVDEIRVYRSYVNTPGVYYRVRKVRIGATDTTVIPHQYVTFKILEGDIALGPQLRPGMNTPPPTDLSCLCHWEISGRLCGARAGSSYVFYSDVPDIATGAYRPGAWPALNYFKVGGDDPIMGLVSLRDGLLVIKERSTWLVTGTPPNIAISQVYARDDMSAIGALSRTAIAVDEDMAFILSNSGLYILRRVAGFDGLSAARLDENIAGINILPPFAFDSDKYPRVYLAFDRNKKQLWIISGKQSYVGSIIGDGGRDSVEWSEYEYTAVSASAPTYVGNYTTCVITVPNIFFGDSKDKHIPVVCIGHDESILMMGWGLYDVEHVEYGVIYRGAWFRIPGMQRARMRKVNVTCGMMTNVASVTVGYMTDELPNEQSIGFTQYRKSGIARDLSGIINIHEAPDDPSSPQAIVSAVGSLFKISLTLSPGAYVSRLAAMVQPVSQAGRYNTGLIIAEPQYTVRP